MNKRHYVSIDTDYGVLEVVIRNAKSNDDVINEVMNSYNIKRDNIISVTDTKDMWSFNGGRTALYAALETISTFIKYREEASCIG